MEVLTASEMRKLENAAMEAGTANGPGLMEAAGRGVVAATLAQFPALETKPGRALVLCGPGNNGGDGYVVARLLRLRGWQVRVMAFGDVAALPPDAAAQAGHWRAIGDIDVWDPACLVSLPAPDIVIDALFGIGLSRAPSKDLAQVLALSHRSPWDTAPLWVAVDCPSGLDLDRGVHPGDGARADLTVTFHCPKPGHLLAAGPAHCGKLRIVDIGLAPVSQPQVVISGPAPGVASDTRWARRYLPKARGQGHKYEYGHAMVFAGGVGRGGAARLAGRAALRVGAGLVTLLCPPAALQENAATLDAVMLRALKEPLDLPDAVDQRVTALCLGPGAGLSSRTRDTVLQALQLGRRTVLDADALTVFADAPGRLFDALHPEVILTPHDGEFMRLFPDLSNQLTDARSRMAAVRAASARAGAVVLLKGQTTLVAAPGGPLRLHAAQYERQTPWLATAGAGDVLSGLIAGLAAGTPDVRLDDIAGFAAWLHVEAARAAGPGLIAEDLPGALPRVLAHLCA